MNGGCIDYFSPETFEESGELESWQLEDSGAWEQLTLTRKRSLNQSDADTK
jgi:hypothetical protein